MYKEQLFDITRCILNSNTAEEELMHVELLSEFFAKLTCNNESLKQQESTETLIQGGIAISSADAAHCLHDQLRTARFIKGTYLAIKELIYRFPGEKINILYAGCGPYAALLMPVLPFFRKEEIEITLLDINEFSLQSVKKLISDLNVEHFITDIILANAITYQYPQSKSLHLVITETMFHALIREPQVAITANLSPQLVKNGILIPEEIKLDLVYTYFAKEPYLQEENGKIKNSCRDIKRIHVDTLFSMNKENSFSDKIIYNSCQFESSFYKLPEKFNNHPDVCIFTEIKIFKELILSEAASFITNPYCVESIFNMANHTHFKLIYNFRNIPNWTYKLK